MRYKVFKVMVLLISFMVITPQWIQGAEKKNRGNKTKIVFQEEREDQLFIVKIRPHDPLERYNRVAFKFNDTLYTWVFTPLSTAYSFIIPKTGREKISNVGRNIAFPVRLVSTLCQGEGREALIVCKRFCINTTIGVLGIFDAAKNRYNINPRMDDMGKAFATWGMPSGAYFVIPIMGPSTLRNAGGRVGDFLLTPTTWLPPPFLGVAFSANEMSLTLPRYHAFTENTYDPYIKARDTWYLLRDAQVNNLTNPQKARTK
jgi:phospholipid-binding lipoprotein MlaA